MINTDLERKGYIRWAEGRDTYSRVAVALGTERLVNEPFQDWINRMTEREQKFANFFASEVQLVESLTFEQLEAHIAELEDIRLEASAKLQAATENKKRRVSKLDKAERDKLISKPDLSVSDAINSVERRKARLTAAEKLQQSLASLGVDTKDISSVMAGIKVDESKQAQANKNAKFTFNKPASPEPAAAENSKHEQSNASSISESEKPEEVFDPSKLFG